MTPEKQRLAIASACGWHEKPEPHGSFNATAWWQNEHRYPSYEMPVPNYREDLNAMHEAEEILKQKGVFTSYLSALAKTCGFKAQGSEAWFYLHAGLEAVASATAAQRAEAFLKTLNLWES